jgi:hypothetical protein
MVAIPATDVFIGAKVFLEVYQTSLMRHACKVGKTIAVDVVL